MSLPSQEECLRLYGEYHVPEAIKEHMLQVTKVALLLADRMSEVGTDVDRDLVGAMALCHDLFKAATIDLRKPTKFGGSVPEEVARFWDRFKERHEDKHEIAIFEEELGDQYPSLAEALQEVEPHPVSDLRVESAIVKYADCRVVGSDIVSLDDRVDDLKERYDYFMKHGEEIRKSLKALERRLFEGLGISPEEVREEVEKHGEGLL